MVKWRYNASFILEGQRKMTEALNENRRCSFRIRVRYVPTCSIDPYCYITWSAGRTRFSYYEQLFQHKWSGIKEQNPQPAKFNAPFFLLVISFLAFAKFLPSRWLSLWPRSHLKLQCVPLSPIHAKALTHCGRVTQICVFNTVKLGTSASSP